MTEYRSIKKISEGSFGFIELIEDETGKTYARKKLHEQRHRDNIYKLIKKRFYDEVSFLQRHPHKNITPIVSAHVREAQPWYIMPLATASLKHELDKLQRDHQLAVNALYDILSALKFIHSEGYYHRDLCCANVLRFDDEHGTTFKLSDLGTVTSTASTGPFHKIDSGHLRYAPPEITKLPMIGSEKSDYYGFGAILHEIFGKKERQPRKKIANEIGPFGHIMRKCTEENPDDRYDRIDDLRQDFDAAIKTNC